MPTYLPNSTLRDNNSQPIFSEPARYRTYEGDSPALISAAEVESAAGRWVSLEVSTSCIVFFFLFVGASATPEAMLLLLRGFLVARWSWGTLGSTARDFTVDSRFRLVPFFGGGAGLTDEVVVNVFCNFFQFDESTPVAIASPSAGLWVIRGKSSR